ncbi:unnamed protein product [Prunus armeniaca]
MDESNIQMKPPHVENSCSLITKLNNSVCTNTSSYEETSPENCSVDHEADLKHSREDSLMHEEEQLHDEEKTGSDALQQAGEVLGQSAQSAMDVEVLCMDHLRKRSELETPLLKLQLYDHGGSNHSAKVWPANGCTGERGTGKSAKKLDKGRTAKEEASKREKVREIQKNLLLVSHLATTLPPRDHLAA